MAGVGLGVAVLPQLADLLIAVSGWRSAYAGVGVLSVALMLPMTIAMGPVPAFAKKSAWSARRNGARRPLLG